MEDEDVAATGGAGEPLTEDEAWALLRSEQVGRLAYHVGAEVDIAPVNHVVVGRQVLFRTAPGSKLFGVVAGKTVAFEVDRLDDAEASSAVLRGVARRLTAEEAAEHAGRLHPWVTSEKPEVVAVEAVHVSGRRFRLSR